MNDVPQNDAALARWFFNDGDNDRLQGFPSKYKALQNTGSPYAENYREGWESFDRFDDEMSDRKAA